MRSELFSSIPFKKKKTQHRYTRYVFDLFLVIHTSRALEGSPLAVPSRGPRGIPSLVVAIALACRCNCREFAFAADCRGLQWKLPPIIVAIAVNCGRNCGGNYRRLPRSVEIAVAIAEDGREMPWFAVEIAVAIFVVVFRGNFRVNCRGNCRGNRHGSPRNAVVFRGNCSGLTSVKIADKIAVECRGNCRLLPWHLPW